MSTKTVARIRIGRVYEPAKARSGCRILVDRMWPRGVKKEELKIDHWMKGLAPSRQLREWFQHDPARWDEFRKRYSAELDSQPEAVEELRDLCASRPVTLLFAAKDEAHNNAVALREYLESRMGRNPTRRRAPSAAHTTP